MPVTYSIGPNVERLRQIITYIPETGDFITQAGNITGGALGKRALMIGIDGRKYAAHRVAWAMVTGEWPTMPIDHANGDFRDNRWDNLRKATQSQNCANRRKQSNNTSGFKGVNWSAPNNKWRAKIKANGKHVHLGLFESAEAAHAAYTMAAHMFYGEFARSA